MTRRPSTWTRSRRLFLALVGVTYAVAFGSLWVQLDGLFGHQGIVPLGASLARIDEALGGPAPLRVPTLFWLGASDAALHAACAAGLVLSALLVAGLAPRLVALLLWAGYLSFVSVGQPFLSFQWDVLLLETGLLAVLHAPGGLRPFGAPRRAAGGATRSVMPPGGPGAAPGTGPSGDGPPPPSPVVRWLLRWLLFRLVFLSGVVKLASGDEVWWDLTALEFHYWTQPLPHALSHVVHHLPSWVHTASTAVMFAIELGVAWLVFGPRRLRTVAAASIVLLMVAITATGNYGFFNLLTVVLCVPLLDDRALAALWPFGWARSHALPTGPMAATEAPSEGSPTPARTGTGVPLVRRLRHRAGQGFVVVFAVVAVAVTTVRGLQRAGGMVEPPALLAPVLETTAPFLSFNAYGLFADMTETRPEVVVEGSRDLRTWTPYRFRFKPGDPEDVPRFALVHMPRLDWQMWFAALRGRLADPWLVHFQQRLLDGSPAVLALLEGDPFAGEPPRYVRTMLHDYRFSSPAERREGTWWRRRLLRPYGPVLTLDEQGELAAVR